MAESMMQVFMTCDNKNYEQLDPGIGEELDKIAAALQSRDHIESWDSPKVKICHFDPYLGYLRPADCVGFRTEFVLRQRALTSLMPILDQSGCQILELECSEAKLFLVKPPHIDALDLARSKPYYLDITGKQRLIWVNQPVFWPERIGRCAIFKVATHGIRQTYVTNTFVERWISTGLTGQTFDPMWSG